MGEREFSWRYWRNLRHFQSSTVGIYIERERSSTAILFFLYFSFLSFWPCRLLCSLSPTFLTWAPGFPFRFVNLLSTSLCNPLWPLPPSAVPLGTVQTLFEAFFQKILYICESESACVCVCARRAVLYKEIRLDAIATLHSQPFLPTLCKH